MKFWEFKNKADEEAELRISGDIIDDEDAWFYEWFGDNYAAPNVFRDELASYKGKNITVWIDSYGGNVFAATGIYNALKEHKGKVTVKIDGKAMSAATVIAMAGDEIQMSPLAIFMIHNPLTYAGGYASDLRKAADVLDTVKDSIMNAYVIKTGRTKEEISELMDDETYMSAKQAIKEGFVDSILYTDGENSDGVFNFSFNRTQILNSSKDAVKKILEFKAGADPEPDPVAHAEDPIEKPIEEPAEPEPTNTFTEQDKINALQFLEMEEKIYG